MLEVMRHVSIFSEIKDNDRALESLAACMVREKFQAGKVLIAQGEQEEEFFVLITGEVSVMKKTPEGDPYKVVILKAAAYPSFGEGGLIEGEMRSASVVCETAVECLVLTRAKFNEFCVSNPQFALPILKRIAQILIGRLNQTSNDMMLLHKALMNEIRSS